MRCPDCDTRIPDNERARYQCSECNTHLVISDYGEGDVRIRTETPILQRIKRNEHDKSSEDKMLRHVRFVPDGAPTVYGETKCHVCSLILSPATKIEGTITVGFKRQETVINDIATIKHIPIIKKVFACYTCMDSLKGMRKTGDLTEDGKPVYEEFSTVKPTVHVNTVEERLPSGVTRKVRNVTGDTGSIEPTQMKYSDRKRYGLNETSCESYVGVNGHCLYCGRDEFDPKTGHETHQRIKIEHYTYLERYNVNS